MPAELDYTLEGAGWARCTVRVGGQVADVTASYLGDALGDLAAAVTAMLRGHPKAVASFAEEPGEYRWVLEPTSPTHVRVRILEFPEDYPPLPDDRGAVLLDAECSRTELGAALLACLEAVEGTYGIAGYRQKWIQHEFPLQRIAELKELLG